MSYMATQAFSARWRVDIVDGLARRSAAIGTTKSRLAEQYVEEGLRADEHPGVLFRRGPAGRRAALVAGPDIWEVIATLKSVREKGDAAVAAAADALAIDAAQVRVALRYYGAYPEEIDERIRRNAEEADLAEAAWRREQSALA